MDFIELKPVCLKCPNCGGEDFIAPYDMRLREYRNWMVSLICNKCGQGVFVGGRNW